MIPDASFKTVDLPEPLAPIKATDSPFCIKKRSSLSGYNLVILHQLPSATNSATDLLSGILKAGIPVLFIVGGQTDIQKLNNLSA